MIGNFGAAISPVLLRFIRKQTLAETEDEMLSWHVAFFFCAAAFVFAGLCAFSMNALIPVVQKRAEPTPEDESA
jgi:nitrate/nitrite transporter NarK